MKERLTCRVRPGYKIKCTGVFFSLITKCLVIFFTIKSSSGAEFHPKQSTWPSETKLLRVAHDSKEQLILINHEKPLRKLTPKLDAANLSEAETAEDAVVWA